MASTYSAGANQQYQNNALLEVKLVIHHQLPGTELVSPNHGWGAGARCYISPDQRVDIGSTAQTGYSINLTQGKPFGVLTYELKSTKQYSKDTISGGDETRCIRLFMIWKVNSPNEFLVVSHLIECDKGIIWNGGELAKLANRYKLYDIHVSIEKTYLMRNNAVLMTRANVTRERGCYKLEMTISETSIKYDTQKLQYYNVAR
jgi:hypothetical protein